MKFQEQGTSWFLAQLKRNSANIADTNLKRQGFQTFLPLEEATCTRNGKSVKAMRPLFPGYIFVAFDETDGLWRKVNSTYGLARLVSFGREPTKVPLGLISQLILRCDENSVLLPPKRLTSRNHVDPTKGHFANFVEEIENIAPDRRVWVLMEFMGGSRGRFAV